MAEGLVNADLNKTAWAEKKKILKPLKPPPGTENFDVKELETAPETSEIVEEIEVSRVREEISTPQLVARRVADLMADGKSLQEAQTDVPEMLRLSKDLAAQVKKIIAMGHVPADITRAAVRAVRNRVMIDAFQESLTEENPEQKNSQRKIALEASKIIGADPEIGLNQPPAVQVQINIEDISDLLQKVKDEETEE